LAFRAIDAQKQTKSAAVVGRSRRESRPWSGGSQSERPAGQSSCKEAAMQIARLLVAVGCCLLLPSYTAAFPSSVTHVHEQPAKPTTDY